MANYKKLVAWQKAHKLALSIYKLSEKFPKEELFGLTSQLRRAGLSIPLNIVEGYNRKSKREFIHFLDISLGSLAEVEYLIEFAIELGYIKSDDIKDIVGLIEDVGKLLWGLQQAKRDVV